VAHHLPVDWDFVGKLSFGLAGLVLLEARQKALDGLNLLLDSLIGRILKLIKQTLDGCAVDAVWHLHLGRQCLKVRQNCRLLLIQGWLNLLRR